MATVTIRRARRLIKITPGLPELLAARGEARVRFDAIIGRSALASRRGTEQKDRLANQPAEDQV